MDFVERLKEADRLLDQYMDKAEEIGRILSRVISEALGIEVDYQLGDYDTGPDVIWLKCKNEEDWKGRIYPLNTDYHTLCYPIEEVFPELSWLRISIESCIHISPEEYERVKEALRKLREGKEGNRV